MPFWGPDMNLVNLSLAATAVLALAGTASAQTIVNGGFESAIPLNGTGGGWTSSGVDGAGGWRSNEGNPGGTFILNSSGGSDDPTLEQIILGLTAGEQYVITGSYASAIVGTSPPLGSSFAVDIDGQTIYTGFSGAIGAWRSFESAAFTATGTTATLRLRAEINGTDNDFKVDNFAIRVVPTPGAMALLGAGALVVARRRRK